MHKELLIRHDRCLGCRSCELACAAAHSKAGNLIKAMLAGERLLGRIFVSQVRDKKVPLNCRHCEDAPCIDACITGAMHRDSSGVVTNDGGSGKCTGCWMCVMVCPYGVIHSDLMERKAVKCDRACLNDGGVPACVSACPTGALLFAHPGELSDEKRKEFISQLTD
ncbi:4Fe-4S dicluster domain-containing protein [Desulfotruncus alcoholivorax]|uniref:4Fe-4S dicluster domain-containing protein n=1 Tax=Desulfotruncus alcoholivorax TaxID=265477 RepID=UPI000420293F|nr:4Fe-4S dicluster domain-containing protein [Desulfotruncus alcoholivorax]